MEEEKVLEEKISEKDKQALYMGCFYPEYTAILESIVKPVRDSAKQFSEEKEVKRLNEIVDAMSGDKLFSLFESIYLPHFFAMSKTDQKLIIASAKQRIAVATVADKTYEDFLSLYFVPEDPYKTSNVTLN